MVRYCELCAIKEVSNDLKKVRELGLLLPEGSKDACDGCGLDYLKKPLGPPPEPPKKASKKTLSEKDAAAVVASLDKAVYRPVTDPVRAVLALIKHGYEPNCTCHHCRRVRDMIEKAGV